MVVNHIIDNKVNSIQEFYIEYKEDETSKESYILATGKINQLTVKITLKNFFLTLQNQDIKTTVVNNKILTLDSFFVIENNIGEYILSSYKSNLFQKINFNECINRNTNIINYSGNEIFTDIFSNQILRKEV